MPPKFGRRAGGEEAAGDVGAGAVSSPAAGAATQKRPPAEAVQTEKLRNLEDDVDEQKVQSSAKKSLEEKEQLVRRVAEAPVGYSVPMPKLADLNISNLWSDFLLSVNQDFDMSALTACLSQQLDDEDVPWNPDMLLVQLMSDILDTAHSGNPGGAADGGLLPDDVAAAGAARRRRKLLLEDVEEPAKAVHRRRNRSGDKADANANSDNSAAPGSASDRSGSAHSPKSKIRARSGEGKKSQSASKPEVKDRKDASEKAKISGATMSTSASPNKTEKRSKSTKEGKESKDSAKRQEDKAKRSSSINTPEKTAASPKSSKPKKLEA